jgi:glycosyltransferase involved in cell wall biosynthesis
MKIVLLRVCGAFGGGIFKTVGRLMNNLDHDVFEQHLIFQIRTSIVSEDWLRHIHPAIRLHPWKCTREIDPVRDTAAVLRLHRLIRTIRPDIIHAHSSKAGLVRVLAPFHRGTPIIYTPHGFGFLQENLPAPKRLLISSVEHLLAACGGEIVACRRVKAGSPPR